MKWVQVVLEVSTVEKTTTGSSMPQLRMTVARMAKAASVRLEIRNNACKKLIFSTEREGRTLFL